MDDSRADLCQTALLLVMDVQNTPNVSQTPHRRQRHPNIPSLEKSDSRSGSRRGEQSEEEGLSKQAH